MRSILTLLVAATLALGGHGVAATALPERPRAEAAVVDLAARWARAVTERRDVGPLVSTASVAYYARLADAALHADAPKLESLHPTDQLQALFLRDTVDVLELLSWSGRDVLRHAVEQGWIGQDLRASDELRDILIDGDHARGRLYKFGRDDRPDRGLQYFVRENGDWRVDIRGERERLRVDFESFIRRAGLTKSEASFFILETRLGRKVTPDDFLPLVDPEPRARRSPYGRTEHLRSAPVLRVVALRACPDDPSLVAATIEDRIESIRYVVRPRARFGEKNEFRLTRVTGNRVSVESDGSEQILRLDTDGPPLSQRLAAGGTPGLATLVDVARLGESREGMMSQWRNVGLRDRPQLLQQAWLVPEYGSSRDEFAGLRVRRVVPGSFWDQIGLAEGDLLEQVNGMQVNTMQRWKHTLRVAETQQALSVVVDRGGRRLTFHTRTIPPRASGDPT